eukprot:6188454-Pleurochrysis_carterae.AAC.1
MHLSKHKCRHMSKPADESRCASESSCHVFTLARTHAHALYKRFRLRGRVRPHARHPSGYLTGYLSGYMPPSGLSAGVGGGAGADDGCVDGVSAGSCCALWHVTSSVLQSSPSAAQRLRQRMGFPERRAGLEKQKVSSKGF